MTMNKPAVQDMIDDAAIAAANAMAKIIQEYLAIKNGGNAPNFFEGANLETLTRMARNYYACEQLWRQVDEFQNTIMKGFE